MTATRRRIVLMRHGSVVYFDEAGRPLPPETVPLDARGREQADAAGRLFAAEAVRFDRVIVSGLPRTVETARRALAAAGQAVEPECWPGLEEIRGGRLSAIPDDELDAAFTGAFSGSAPEDRRFLGGESVGGLMDRVHPCIDRLRADKDWDTALLVLHGGVNRAILSYALTGQRLFFGGIEQAPGCINLIDVGSEPADSVVRLVNHSPLAALHGNERGTTMETLLAQYRRFRSV
ncbi:MAG: histidine phosphatase family protein [Burkholderiaceae bacterium]